MNVLNCEQARRLLGASRRDDWTADELGALGAHLATCPECRQVEARYREVGEHIRQLPSTPPPAWFRARVFAAIAADQEAQRRGAATHAVRRPATATPTLERVAGAELAIALYSLALINAFAVYVRLTDGKPFQVGASGLGALAFGIIFTIYPLIFDRVTGRTRARQPRVPVAP